ncbi:MAG: hypothetical protein WBG42_16675 [Cryomorphaceae bacterium]
MKSKILLMLVASVLSGAIMSQSAERMAIEKTVQAFAKAGEKQDVQAFEYTLHDDYQVIMNRLFGSEETVILSKADYLKKNRNQRIWWREAKGDDRTRGGEWHFGGRQGLDGG